MTSGFDKCIRRMQAVAGKDDEGNELISRESAAKMLKALAEERKKQVGEGLNDSDTDFLAKIQRYAQAEQTAAIIQKRNTAINMLRKKEFFDYAENFKDDHEALQAFLAGINKPIEGARNSVAARQQALHNQYVKGFLNDLVQENLLPFFNDKKNGRDIAIELHELSTEGGNPGRTNNSPAVKIAKIINKYQDDLINRQNKAGAWIQKLGGYITSQSHDSTKVLQSGFEDWKNFILEKLDLDKTFDGIPQDKWEEQLKESYKGIISGRHQTAAGANEADGLVAFKGPGSLGRKVSEHRVLHFKSPEDWYDYDQRFGYGSTQAAVLRGIDRASRNAALMERMGPNPQAFYDTVKGTLLDRNKENLKVFNKLDGKDQLNFWSATPDHLMAELTGKNYATQDVTLARIAQGLRQWSNMVSLGSSVFSLVPHLASKAADLRFQGQNPISAYGRSFMDIFTGIGNKQQQIIAHALGAGFEGQLHESIGKLVVQDQLPGTMSSLTRLFFKLNFMEPFVEAQKMGMARFMSSFLGGHAEMEFNQLHPRTQDIMKLYGINDLDWDVIRAAKSNINGTNYILPENIVDPEVATKYRQYIADRVDYGVLSAGVRERATYHRGTQPGTWEGEFLRFLGQFRLFTTSVIEKNIPKEFYGNGGGLSGTLAVAHLMTASTILGYMAMSAKDIAKGFQPRPLEDPRTWKAAMLQGGGLGIYGDFLFGEFDREGGGLVSTLAGPVIGKLDPIGKMYSQMMKGINPKTGEPYITSSEVLQYAKNNTPFLNLFYLRAALDYMFLYDVQENLNPGFLRRMESRIMDERNQQFILPPSENPGLLRR